MIFPSAGNMYYSFVHPQHSTQHSCINHSINMCRIEFKWNRRCKSMYVCTVLLSAKQHFTIAWYTSNFILIKILCWCHRHFVNHPKSSRALCQRATAGNVDSLFQYIIWHSTKIEQQEKMERKWLFSRPPSLHVGLNGFHDAHVPWFASALCVNQIDRPKLFGPGLSF